MSDRVEAVPVGSRRPGPMRTAIGWLVESGEAQLFLAALLAGSGWLFSLNALKELPPLLFIGSRFMIAGLLIHITLGLPSLGPMRRVWKGLALSSFAMAAAMTLWIIGLKHTSHIGVAAFITATGNLMVPLVGLVIFRWRLALHSATSLAVAAVGLALLLLNAGSTLAAPDVMFLVSALLWAVSLVVVREKARDVSAASVSVAQLFCTGAIVAVGSMVTEELPATIPSFSTLGWFLASLVLSTCLRFVLQFEGQSRTAPAKAGVMMIFEPAWAMVFAFIFVGASITSVQAAGCAVISAAVAREALARKAPSG
ncbi:drug/metabolite transporter (DMT)-like permease [Rhizobium sp. BK181]|uniref:DMT family transporter n=1 Tax=Rhizobium sp. BK181 TaxID=2587072 RepID=UPI00160D5BAF|nr:DMT family transporter [Rhizobium sp. BK181]MBB3315909.1 drug/metabolite transporter (DMT)-like permease [Rhizobium sp. BK181]